LDRLITRTFKIDEINEALQAMKEHRIVGRWVCAWD
jgi:hypothetical protein